jgi:hypothetical protein
MVFLTICPHCQQRFIYNQWDFLVSRDGCGKNFFAFKLHEQAVPSRSLSAGPNSSRFPPELISFQFQQHDVPNRQVQYSKDRATGGNMDRAMKTVPSLIWPNTGQIGRDCQVKILPKVIYLNWSPDWAPSRINPLAEYAIVENHQVH